MLIQKIHRSEIKPAEYNPRKISDEARRKLALSLTEFDLVEPLVWNQRSGNLVGGHQRLFILDDRNGLDYEIDVSVVDLPPAKEKALNIALNNQLMAGEWDFPKLNDLICEIDTGEFDIEITGFNYGELEKIVGYERPGSNGGAPEAQINKADELQKKWRVERGQIWEIGKHRLMCGDSEDATDVSYMLNGQKPDMLFADPPYGIALDTDWSDAKSALRMLDGKGIRGGNKYSPVIGDERLFNPAHIFDYFNVPEMFLWGADYYADLLPNRNSGCWIVWDKRLEENADRMFGSCFELCWSKQKHRREIARIKWAGVFGIEHEPERERFHPTQKPVALINWFLERYSESEMLIIDPFLGSGTTMAAAQQLGRICYGMEIHPPYCAVILERMSDMGLTPKLLDAPK